jgi:hypothetical protein
MSRGAINWDKIKPKRDQVVGRTHQRVCRDLGEGVDWVLVHTSLGLRRQEGV